MGSGKDILKIGGIAALGATGLGLAGVGPLAGALGAAEGAGLAGAAGGLALPGAAGAIGLAPPAGAAATMGAGAASTLGAMGGAGSGLSAAGLTGGLAGFTPHATAGALSGIGAKDLMQMGGAGMNMMKGQQPQQAGHPPVPPMGMMGAGMPQQSFASSSPYGGSALPNGMPVNMSTAKSFPSQLWYQQMMNRYG